MKLYNSLKPGFIQMDFTAGTKEEFLRQLLENIKIDLKNADPESILEKLMEREQQSSTSIGNHSAVPHTKLKNLKEPIIAVGISKDGFLYDLGDKEPVHLVILILSPSTSPIIHLQILAAAASLIKRGKTLIDDMLAASHPEELVNIIRQYEDNNE